MSPRTRSPQWVRTGDAVAALVAMALLAGGMLAQGYAGEGMARAAAWTACAALGLWSLAGWAAGRWEGDHLKACRWVLGGMAAMIVYTGLQLVPLPAGLATRLSPPLAEAAEAMKSAGIEVPSSMPLATSPEKARAAWDQLVACTLFFAGAALLCSRRTGARRLLLAAMAFSCAEGIIGLAASTLGGLDRGHGAIFNPNHHAAAIVVCVPLMLVWLLRRWQTRAANVSFGSDPTAGLLGLAFLAILGWLASFSRGSLLLGGTVLAGWAAWEAYGWHSRRHRHDDDEEERVSPADRRRRATIAGVLLIPLAAAALLVLSVMQGFSEKLEQIPQGTRRAQLWLATLDGFSASPVFGIGLRGAEHAINRYVEMPIRTNAIWSHNDWVQVPAELGIAGSLVLAFFLGGAAWAHVRDWQRWQREHRWKRRALQRAAGAGCTAVLAHALVDFHLRIPAVSFLFLIVLALALQDTLCELEEY